MSPARRHASAGFRAWLRHRAAWAGPRARRSKKDPSQARTTTMGPAHPEHSLVTLPRHVLSGIRLRCAHVDFHGSCSRGQYKNTVTAATLRAKPYRMWIIPRRSATASARSGRSPRAGEDVPDVHLGRFLADAQRGRELLLRSPVARSRSTSSSRAVSTGMASRAASTAWMLRRDRPAAGVHHSDGGDEVVGERILQQVGSRAGPQRSIDVLVSLVDGEHDDPTRSRRVE